MYITKIKQGGHGACRPEGGKVLLVNQDSTNAYNMDFITGIFVDTRKIRVSTTAGRTWGIGEYGSEDEAKAALERIAGATDNGHTVIHTPRPEQVRVITSKTRQHFANGGAQKGHGGS